MPMPSLEKIIDDAGYEGKFGHSLGHGLGLQVHEEPNVGPRGIINAAKRNALHNRARHLHPRLGRRQNRRCRSP